MLPGRWSGPFALALLAVANGAVTGRALQTPASEVGARTAPWIWRRAEAPDDGRELRGLALDAARGRLAVGDARGVALRDSAGRWSRRRTRAAVRDVAFGADGALWIATERGLLRLASDGRLEDRSPAPGEAARDVRRVATLSGTVAVATAGGAFVSGQGREWSRIEGPFAGAATRAVALVHGRAALWLWIGTERGALRVRLGQALGRGSLLRAVSVALPASAAPVLDLVARPQQDSVLLLGRRTLATYEPADGAWSVLRPSLPPGATLRRLALASGRLWLATDRGLLESERPGGPWRRAAPPAGSAAVSAVAAAADRIWLATATGLLVGEPATRATRPAPSRPDRCAPAVQDVHAAVLAYAGLEARRIERLRRGVVRRGLLPVLTLRGARGGERNRNRDHDEAFVSGDLRQLFDRERDRSRDFEVGVTLSWDLGALLYDPEQIDVSQEARRLIELRDDVLDEVNQLYFERLRLLAESAAAPPGSPEATRSLLRAEELGAGLDAWTGGWFERRTRGTGCSSPR